MPSNDDPQTVAKRVLVEPELGNENRHRALLEGELLARFRDRVPTQTLDSSRWRRFALGGVLSVAALAAACRIPTEYELDVGHRIAIEIPLRDVGADGGIGPDALAHFIEQNYSVDAIEVSAHVEADTQLPSGWTPGEPGAAGTMVVQLEVVGENIDTEDIWRDMLEEYPVLEGSRIDAESLEASISGTWGGRLSHAWLDVVIDEYGVEEAKRQLLEDLAARGIDPVSAEITVTENDEPGRHKRRVEVRVETKENPPPATPPENPH